MKKKKIKKLLRYTCTGCGNCCSDTVVPVNHRDLERLVKGTGKKADDIVKMYSSEEIDWDEDREGWIELSSGRRIMGLRKKQDRCMFLNSRNRCKAYVHRPVTCRSFPYDIAIKSGRIAEISLNDSVNCNVEKGGRMCSFREITEIALAEDRDDETFYDIIRKWNRKKGGKGRKKDFLEFLGF